jgi:hypothetical protein
MLMRLEEDTMKRSYDRKFASMAIGTALLALAATTLTPARSGAQTDVDLRAGVYTDMSAMALGGGLLTGVGSSWWFNPNLEAAFGDGGNLITLNGDFHYDFPTGDPVSIYLGAGPALLFANPDGGDTSTDVGLNLIGGVAGRGAVRPFGQVKAVVSDNTEVALMGGIRF